MPTPVLTKGGTKIEWSAENPILPNGFVGIETDTQYSKTGDGLTSWNALEYDLEPGLDKEIIVYCNGYFDDKKINTAITRLSSIGGGIVQIIPPSNGVCDIRSAVLPKSNIWIRGTGETTLRLANNVSYSDLQGLANVIWIYAGTENITNVRISDLKIDGNRANQTLSGTQDNAFNGICARGNGSYKASNFVIENITSFANGFHGVAVYDRTENFVARNNYFYGNGFRGLHVHSNDASNVSQVQITGNRSTANGVDAETGLMVYPMSGIFAVFDNTTQVIVSGNTIWSEKGPCIELNGKETALTSYAEHSIVTNNTLYDGGIGIKISGLLRNTTITGNTIKSINKTGKISGSSGSGVHFASAGTEGSESIMLSNNIITNCEAWGIQFDTASAGWKNINILGNVISENGTDKATSTGGVQLKSFTGICNNNIINSNNVGAGAPRQLYVFSATNSIISNNYVNGGAVNHPVLIVDTGAVGNVLTGNYANRANGTGTAVQIMGASNIINNTILQGSNTISVTGANVTGLRVDAVTASGGNTATLTNSPVSGNPAEWVTINVRGTLRSTPVW